METKDQLAAKAEELESRLRKTSPSDTTAINALESEAAALMIEARSRVAKVNRQPGENGYPLSLRKAAARKTLIDQGWDPAEAEQGVEDMATRGLLPDPPQR